MPADLPVVVEIARADGSQEFIRVGTARRDGAHFVLDLGALRISPLDLSPPHRVAAAVISEPRLPPPQGGTVEDLEYIAARARSASLTSAPCASAEGGRSGWKPKCGPQAWSTISGTPAAWATSAHPSTSAAIP